MTIRRDYHDYPDYPQSAPIRVHAPTEESRRAAGWGRLNLRIPPELWAEVARIPADQRGRTVCRYLADRLGVQLKPRHSDRKDNK